MRLPSYCPFWLHNMVFEFRAAKRDGAIKVWILIAYAPCINTWMDENRVKGSRENTRICLFIFRMIRRVLDPSQLVYPFGGLSDLVRLDKRLSGLK